MTRSAWYMTAMAAAIAGLGCACGPDPVPGCDPARMICVTDGGMGDAEVGDSGPPPDAPDGGMVSRACGTPGRTGGVCRAMACLDGLECFAEFTAGGAPEGATVRNTFGIGQAESADPENETFNAVTPPVPADDVPLTFATNSLCSEQCDTTAETDTCAECASCSGSIGNDVLGIGPWVFIQTADRAFGIDTGLCRGNCTFDPEGRGMGCPEGYTCDAFTNVCLEACQTDANCNAALVITEDGEYGSWIVPDGGRTCNMTTGRCDWAGPTPEAQVGDVCERPTDCGTDVGVCLRGTCGETQCNNPALAPDTMSDFTCDGGRGICLGTGGNNGAVCIEGCNTAMDCNPGNACIPITMAAGPFTGYCFAICDTVDSAALTGEADLLFGCRTEEQCDMPDPDTDDGDPTTVEDFDPDGVCRPTCDPAMADSCEAGQLCEVVEGSTPAYGFCRTLGDFCFPAGTESCFGGQVCDNILGASTFGRCVDPCTDTATDCTAPATCVDATGPEDLRGLCAEPCTSPTTCGTGRTCRIPAGTTAGFCVEMPT